MMVPELTPEAWAAIGIFAALVGGGVLGRVWRPVRRWISMGDVIVGRPARYPGDPEERPGLVKRLDDLDANVREVRAELSRVEKKVDDIEGCSDD